MLIRMRFENLTETERGMIRDFLKWLCDKIFTYLNRATNIKKIEVRLDYIKRAKWIKWIGEPEITVNELMDAIHKSFKIRKKKELWEITFDDTVMIPHTTTSITKFLRFLDNGDNIVRGTGILQFVKRAFNHIQLNKWWKGYVMLQTSAMSDGKVISD